MIHLPDINVVLMDNPFGIKGSVNKNEDGSYTVIINAKLNVEQQREVYMHEVEHIENGDVDKPDVDIIEYNAHNMEVAMELCV